MQHIKCFLPTWSRTVKIVKHFFYNATFGSFFFLLEISDAGQCALGVAICAVKCILNGIFGFHRTEMFHFFTMEQSRTQKEFVAYMNAYGYDVKWEPHQKYITYTTPENIRCRDSKLFDQTLKRENMELYFRLGGANYLQACRKIAYDHREPTPTLEDAVCGMAGTVAAICALCEDEDSEVSDLARELYYSSLLLQELVEWYQSRRQERENYEEEYEQYHGFDMTMM